LSDHEVDRVPRSQQIMDQHHQDLEELLAADRKTKRVLFWSAVWFMTVLPLGLLGMVWWLLS
jgi:hypothetical protein